VPQAKDSGEIGVVHPLSSKIIIVLSFFNLSSFKSREISLCVKNKELKMRQF